MNSFYYFIAESRMDNTIDVGTDDLSHCASTAYAHEGLHISFEIFLIYSNLQYQISMSPALVQSSHRYC
jgi:hypothetical protein